LSLNTEKQELLLFISASLLQCFLRLQRLSDLIEDSKKWKASKEGGIFIGSVCHSSPHNVASG
jgi:hypothetical protein